MKPVIAFLAAVILITACGGSVAPGQAPDADREGKLMVRVDNIESLRRVDVTVNGEAFTSYLYLESLFKPCLFPLMTADSRKVSRGFPLDTIPSERVDHPHHVGAWFNYGNVNGIDFWGNSGQTGRGRFGTIVHRSVDRVESGAGVGRLDVTMDWLGPDGKKMLEQREKMFFHADGNLRAIDRLITLHATEGPLDFPDTKEGMFAIRVTRGIEEPANEPIRYVDEHGNVTEVEAADNTGVDGEYLSCEGLTGEKGVWGTSARWCILRGTLEGRPVTVAIFDHPGNVGYPTHWHARGYGLFSVNPLGLKDFTAGERELNFRMQPGEQAAFRYRILLSDERLDAGTTEALYNQWLQDAEEEIAER